MHLLFELTPAHRRAAALEPGETVRYASPCDLGLDGRFCDGFALFTDRRFLLLENGKKVAEIPWSSCEGLRAEIYVGCGALVAEQNGVPRLLARFSLRHADRFAEIAGKLHAELTAHPVSVKQGLKERYCVTCGTPLIGGTCPHCTKRKVSFDRFWRLCKPYIARLLLISSLMLLASFCTLYSQQVVKVVLRDFLRTVQGTFVQLIPYLLAMLGLGLGAILASILKKILCVRLGVRMSMDLRREVFDKVQTLSMSYLSRAKAGELMNRITSDTNAIREFMDQVFGNMLSSAVTTLGATAFMFVLNPKLAVLAIVFVPAALLMSRLFRRTSHRLFRAQTRKSDRIKTRLRDVVSGIRVVKSFGREAGESDRFRVLSLDLAKTSCRNETFWAVFAPLLALTMGLGTYFVEYFGGVDVLQGRMPVEELIQFLVYTGMLYTPLGWLANLPRLTTRMLNSLDRVYDVLDEDPEVLNALDATEHALGGNVEFDNVCFGYNSYEIVLDGVSFSVQKGEMIGIVGASGAGKSSMINLLMRLYDVDGGRILLDGIDIRDIDKADLHRQIGVVLQENFLFSGTVLDNIRYSCPAATLEDVIRAAKMANAHDFICHMSDGYNTYIGEHGYTVSGGERQRIAIARAVLADPRLLILDEATSALDTESEELVQQAIERLTKGRTTFAIAHRLSTLRNADRILVLDDHRIAECGTHEELLKQRGIYFNLVTAQSKLHRVPKA